MTRVMLVFRVLKYWESGHLGDEVSGGSLNVSCGT
jgi:hypothetical protein